MAQLCNPMDVPRPRWFKALNMKMTKSKIPERIYKSDIWMGWRQGKRKPQEIQSQFWWGKGN